MSERCCSGITCGECPSGYVCHCLRITEDAVIEAIFEGAASVAELRRMTTAGTGCTACHGRLSAYIERYSCLTDESSTRKLRTLATV